MYKIIFLFIFTGCSYLGSGCVFETPEFQLLQDDKFIIMKTKTLQKNVEYKLNKDCLCQKESKILNTAVAGLGLAADILVVK